MRNPTEQLYSVLESRYEVILEPVNGVWAAEVWLVYKTGRNLLARFDSVDEQEARDAAYGFLMERPR